ncbi:leucyl aminopeptidase [Ahrensia kielensis]|uniref:Probable cytosol aminopeptidase n=1 Tax=Ahrensia kielensis TaxID=76980 RepID=A0ABU9T332_9HYPH
MSVVPQISFAKLSTPKKGALLIVQAALNDASALVNDADPENVLAKAAASAKFKAKKSAKLDVLAPASAPVSRIVVLGAGELDKLSIEDWMSLGGKARAALANEEQVTVQLSGSGAQAAAFAHGYFLRSYDFDQYKTKKKDDEEKPSSQTVSICLDDVADAKKQWEIEEAVAQGTILARDLVNEPANVLYPIEFAKRASALKKLGVEIDILTEKEMKKLKMGALLGVAQGSRHDPRIVVMKWNGGKAKDKPIAFVGKGVTFDTGGISIKPAAGMEDMKGDMGGAAAVTGLMHALAARKAKANVIGIIGLVENMPDGNAQRPGDIVTSMSGQTIEVINTDAEGRLVLCDALHYCNTKFEPKFMVNLATLTGAVLVALGQEHAGLFSNNDELAENIFNAGSASGEKVWRLPLGPAYDKMIDSKFADMKNTGGRYAGSITAAQFLQRYVGETPWAHLDIAGTAMSSPASDINTSWASGFGVRLLNQMVADSYEG